MPRSPRIEYEGAAFHVMARGNRREPIRFDDDDRELFVERIGAWIREEKGDPFMEGVSIPRRAEGDGSGAARTSRNRCGLSWNVVIAPKGKIRSGRNRIYQSSNLVKDHGERRAEEILGTAQRHFKLSREELRIPERGDLTRAAIAARLFRETTMSRDRIAETLDLKRAAHVSRQIRKHSLAPSEDFASEPEKMGKTREFLTDPVLGLACSDASAIAWVD